MARIIEFPTFNDDRGALTVMDQDLPFEPKRCFVIHSMTQPRGGHGHFRSKTILFALSGKIRVEVRTKGQNRAESEFFLLEEPRRGLYLDPEDWHAFEADSPGAVLLCIASHSYSKDDYFYERP
jgi:dTDP-4-dehydrorhamnose 3,5-epimerase-like enzyme